VAGGGHPPIGWMMFGSGASFGCEPGAQSRQPIEPAKAQEVSAPPAQSPGARLPLKFPSHLRCSFNPAPPSRSSPLPAQRRGRSRKGIAPRLVAGVLSRQSTPGRHGDQQTIILSGNRETIRRDLAIEVIMRLVEDGGNNAVERLCSTWSLSSKTGELLSCRPKVTRGLPPTRESPFGNSRFPAVPTLSPAVPRSGSTAVSSAGC